MFPVRGRVPRPRAESTPGPYRTAATTVAPMRPPHGRATVLTGLGAYVPPQVLSNQDLEARLDTSDAWIQRRVGITSRRIITPGTATSDLAVEAGRRALDTTSGSVDTLILATTTPDYPCPATAPTVAARLGLQNAAAFDVAAVCTGFLYGLATATGLIAAGIAQRVLLIAAEAFTTLIDPDDRNTAVLFGDGAGAVILRAGTAEEPGAIGPIVLGSDGTLSHIIQVPAGGSRQRSSGTEPKPDARFLHMLGRDTYRHAIQRMTEASRQAAAEAGWPIKDIDRLAAHQANARILQEVSRRLDIPTARQLSNIASVGNTGSASLPLLLTQSAATGQLLPGHRVLLTAFGGGLTWGATTVTWPEGLTLDTEPNQHPSP